MIALAHTVAVVWLCGIPVAALVFGWIIAKAPPVIRFHSLRSPYVFWCVTWPLAVFIVGWRMVCRWWLR